MKPANIEIKVEANFRPFIEAIREMASDLNDLADLIEAKHFPKPREDSGPA